MALLHFIRICTYPDIRYTRCIRNHPHQTSVIIDSTYLDEKLNNIFPIRSSFAFFVRELTRHICTPWPLQPFIVHAPLARDLGLCPGISFSLPISAYHKSSRLPASQPPLRPGHTTQTFIKQCKAVGSSVSYSMTAFACYRVIFHGSFSAVRWMHETDLFGYSFVIPATNPREQELRTCLCHRNKGNKIRVTKRALRNCSLRYPQWHERGSVSTLRYRARWESCCADIR